MTISAQGLTKEFTRRAGGAVFTAVEPLDLQVECGELVLLKGRSGSGKSTLVSMLAGVLAPTAGRVLLDGEDLYSLSEVELSALRNEKIGLVPQGHAALRSLSVVENVILPAVLAAKGPVGPERGLELLESVGMSALADASPSELSGGELRRMGVARALMMDPKVVFADEPTAGLDEENAVMVLEMLRRAANEGRAVVVATHEEEATRFADRVRHMVKGCLREDEADKEEDEVGGPGRVGEEPVLVPESSSGESLSSKG